MEVRYSMIIDLKKQNANEHKNVKEEEEVNVVAVTDASDRNIVNLREVKRNIQEKRHYYPALIPNNVNGILELLRKRDSYQNIVVILDDELSLKSGYFIRKNLHRGGFAEAVELCFDINGNRNYIRKKIKKKKFQAKEVEHLCRLNSINISKILGFCVQTDCFEILQEYCGFDLQAAMKIIEWKTVINCQLQSVIIQIAEALYHCNEENIFHLDIKPQNICVTIHQRTVLLKLADFGSSKLADSDFFSYGVTLMYAAPEIHYDYCKKFLLTCDRNSSTYQKVLQMTRSFCANYHGCSVSDKCDLFSVGLVCVYIKMEKDPIKLLMDQIQQNLTKTYSCYPNLMVQLVQDYWGNLVPLIKNLLTGDPLLRWSLNDIFIYMKLLKDKSEMEVSDSPEATVNEVDAIQPTTDEKMNVSPNIPNMNLLFE